MKLHLPVNLLRAVLSLCIAQVAIMPSWAETLYIDQDITCGYNGNVPWSSDAFHSDSSSMTITSNADKQYSVYVDGSKGSISDTALIAKGVTIEKLKSFECANIQGSGIHSTDTFDITGNGSISFHDNVLEKGSNDGAFAIRVSGQTNNRYHDLYIRNNSGDVVFRGNRADVDEAESEDAYAVVAVQSGYHISQAGNFIKDSGGNIEISSNQSVVFEDNTAKAGAAIGMPAVGIAGGDISIDNNRGDVIFKNNTCINYNKIDNPIVLLSRGGAAFALGDMSISHNAGNVEFIGNGTALHNAIGAIAGALAATGLSIVNNEGNVTFAGNFESNAATFPTDSDLANAISAFYPMAQTGTVLRSIVVAPVMGNGSGYFELAAADGTSITFYDSIYVCGGDGYEMLPGTGAETIFNVDTNSGQLTSGDIVFSGARTEQDLAAAQAYLASQGFEAAESNVEASRTSIIGRGVMVASGGLRVEDGAVLRLYDDGYANGSTGGSKSLYMAGTEVCDMIPPEAGITYTAENASSLLVTSGSRIEASTITLGENTEFTVKASEVMAASTFSASEVGPAAELQADNVTLMGGMVYTMDGAYTTLVGDNNTLTLDISNGLGYTINLDESLAYQEGEMMYFVLFTDVEELKIEGGSVDDLAEAIKYNLQLQRDAAAEQPVLGYHAETGTVYVSMKGGSPAVPEPTTATLSLLALMGLAARRRRK